MLRKALERLGSCVAQPRYQRVPEVGSCDKSDVTLNSTSFPGRAPCLIFNHTHHKSLLGRVTRLQSQQNFQLTTKQRGHILFSVRTLADLVRWWEPFVAVTRKPTELILLTQWLVYEGEYLCQWSEGWNVIWSTCTETDRPCRRTHPPISCDPESFTCA
jgi:hypothetical protein